MNIAHPYERLSATTPLPPRPPAAIEPLKPLQAIIGTCQLSSQMFGLGLEQLLEAPGKIGLVTCLRELRESFRDCAH